MCRIAFFDPMTLESPNHQSRAPRHRLKTHSQCQRREEQISPLPAKPDNVFSSSGVTIALTACLTVPSSSCLRCTNDVPGGAYRDRTDDLMLAKQPLSQLS